VYVVLLISLVAARLDRVDRADRPGNPRQQSATVLPGDAAGIAMERRARISSCVTARTVPRSYAELPGPESRLAFGPPVEPAGPLSTAGVNGVLIQRLCGGYPVPGGPYYGPDRRLYLAIDAVVNRRDPNRVVSRGQWAAGVEHFIVRDAQWLRARVVTATVPAGTLTYGMRPRPGADPLVVRTRLAKRTASRFLVLPVRSARGSTVTLTLRLPCGFQPLA
jgi:hypothetical protein